MDFLTILGNYKGMTAYLSSVYTAFIVMFVRSKVICDSSALLVSTILFVILVRCFVIVLFAMGTYATRAAYSFPAAILTN